MNRTEFITLVISELLSDKFNIFLHQKTSIEQCGGWFDSKYKEFVVAMDNPMGFEILIHEYCHYLQWKTNRKWFNEKNNLASRLFGWINGEYLDSITLDRCVNATIELELDCEERAIKLISEYSLDVDVERYCQSANAYLLFYHFVKSNRKWCKKSPYSDKRMLKLMNTKLEPIEYYLNIDNICEKSKKYFEKCFIE